MKLFRKILVPVDFSIHSARAVEVAAELARRFEGALDLVYVFDPMAYLLPGGDLQFTKQQLDEMLAHFDQELTACKRAALVAGAPQVATHVRRGDCSKDICEYAREAGFDLIVMGTHGRKGLNRLLLGSVAQRVVREAPCPVLTVRAESAADDTSSAAQSRAG